MLDRRALLTGLGALIAAPAIVRATSLMPVRAWPVVNWRYPGWDDPTFRVRDWFDRTDPVLWDVNEVYSGYIRTALGRIHEPDIHGRRVCETVLHGPLSQTLESGEGAPSHAP